MRGPVARELSRRDFMGRVGALGAGALAWAALPVAERMLAADPALRAEYERAIAADAELAKDPQARLAWLYRRTPWADDRYLLYPVFVER